MLFAPLKHLDKNHKDIISIEEGSGGKKSVTKKRKKKTKTRILFRKSIWETPVLKENLQSMELHEQHFVIPKVIRVDIQHSKTILTAFIFFLFFIFASSFIFFFNEHQNSHLIGSFN